MTGVADPRALLAALGADLDDEDVADTPRRVAAAYAELLTPLPFAPTTFANSEGYDELVVARSIPFASLCRHHLLRRGGGRRRAPVHDHPGVQAPGVRMVTSALRGRVRDDPRTRSEFLSLAMAQAVLGAVGGANSPHVDRGHGIVRPVVREKGHLCQ